MNKNYRMHNEQTRVNLGNNVSALEKWKYKNGSNIKKKVSLQNLLDGSYDKSNLNTIICTQNIEIRRKNFDKTT